MTKLSLHQKCNLNLRSMQDYWRVHFFVKSVFSFCTMFFFGCNQLSLPNSDPIIVFFAISSLADSSDHKLQILHCKKIFGGLCMWNIDPELRIEVRIFPPVPRILRTEPFDHTHSGNTFSSSKPFPLFFAAKKQANKARASHTGPHSFPHRSPGKRLPHVPKRTPTCVPFTRDSL